jgi:hypothetical protein
LFGQTKATRLRVGLGQRAARAGISKLQLLNLGHDWGVLANYQILRGLLPNSFKEEKVQPGESVIIHHELHFALP